MHARAHIVVVGNAKGGSGKSTTAMHIAIRLLAEGRRVGIIDLDGRQQTLTRYLQHRARFAAEQRLDLSMPTHDVVIERNTTVQTHADLCTKLETHVRDHDVVLLDCPGSDTPVARFAHALADTLLTPVNDSFVDLDLLADIDPDTFRMLEPSWYSEMVWEQRKRRHLAGHGPLDWLVMRNRLSHTEARNKRNVAQALNALCRPLGFRHVPGLGDRVIFRELFLKGLTLTDLRAHKTGVAMTMNHVAAHQEIRGLVSALRLPQVGSDHSYRSASMGSSREARKAG